jgi:hypothetical protein
MTAPPRTIEHVVVVMFDRRSNDEGTAPSGLPITAYLAKQFLVCDRWAAPRSALIASKYLAAHCGRDGGDLEANVFGALDLQRGREARAANWKVYFHDYSILGDALPYVSRCYADPDNVNVANYDECDYPPGARNPLAHPTTTFLQDAAQGTLPAYAFVEPRHGRLAAPVAIVRDADLDIVPALDADPFDGERLVAEVYLALRSPRYWERSVLIVVGPSLPAIVVSAYAPPASRFDAGTAFAPAMIARTLADCFGFPWTPGAAVPSVLEYLAPDVVNDGACRAELETNALALR